MTTTHALRTPAESSTTTTLTVTVLDAATIYEGPETVYRYDLPGTGIVDGWALEPVLDQMEKVCDTEWPDVEVEVVADPSGTEKTLKAVEIVRRQLSATGVTVLEPEPLEPPAPAHSVRSAPPTPAGQEESADAVPVERPRSHRRRTGTSAWIPSGIDPFYIAIAVMVVLVAGVSWWAVGRKDSASAASEAPASAAPTAHTDDAAGGPPTTEPAGSDGKDAPGAGDTGLRPGQQAIEVEGMSLVLPQGFRTSVEDGLVTATGEDPNLRILLAADPLFNVPVDALFGEIKAQIDADPALKDASEDAGRLTYTEDPGDGSRVTWLMWEDKGHQMSVGCHTKFEPNVVQKAACRMAAESLVKQ